MSPGTRQRRPVSRRPGTTVTASSSDRMSAPNAASIRSVWSRLRAGSTTLTGPDAQSPAKSTADFTWALATGETCRIGWSGRAPAIASGSRAPPRRPMTRAPMRESGSMTRSIGRRRSDSSPVSTVANGWPARTPTKSRAVVPEFPQSTTSTGSVSPSSPTP